MYTDQGLRQAFRRPTPFPTADLPAAGPNARHFAWLTLSMFLITLYGSVVPLRFQPQTFAEAFATFRNIGFWTPTDLGARGDWVISIVLYGVLSFAAMGMLAVDRRRTVGWSIAPFVVLASAALSILIEFLQVYFPPRTVSLNDLAVESLGGLLGVGIWLCAGQQIVDWARRVGAVTGVVGLARRLLPGYLAVLVVTQLMPFDFTISLSEISAKYSEGKLSIIPFDGSVQRGWSVFLGKAFIHTLCFLPLGFFAVLATGRAGANRTKWGRVALAALGFAALIEILQVFVYTRYADVTDVLLGTGAILLGWYLGEIVYARWHQALATQDFAMTPQWPSTVWLVLIAIWLSLLVYFNWTPFNFTTEPESFSRDSSDLPRYGFRHFSLFPVVDYYWGNKYNALDQFLKKMLSFAPLGVMMTLALKRLYQPGAGWHVIGTAVVIAAILELGAYFLPQRSPSTTDILLAATGAWIAFALTQHARVVFWAERTLFGYMHQFGAVRV